MDMSQPLHSNDAVRGSFRRALLPLMALAIFAINGMARAQLTMAHAFYTGSLRYEPDTLDNLLPEGVAHYFNFVIVADTGNNRILQIAPGGATTVLLSGTVAGKPLSAPTAVAAGRFGDFFAIDSGNDRVLKWTFGTPGALDVQTGLPLQAPSGLAVDDYENIALSESAANKVVFISNSGKLTTLISPSTTLGGLALKAPAGMAFSNDGTSLYIADSGNNRIVYGSVTGGTFSYAGSINGLDKPTGISVPPIGSYDPASKEIFVANEGGHSVVAEIYNDFEWEVELLVATGSLDPADVDADGDGNLYIADKANNRIDVLSTNPVQFASVNVGASSASALLNFEFTQSTTLSSTTPFQVLTGGIPNLDFKNAGTGTCVAGKTYAAGTICTVGVKYSPMLAGQTSGAVQLYDKFGNALATAYLMGNGLAPQIAWNPGVNWNLATGLDFPSGIAVDRANKVYVSDFGSGNIHEFPAAGTPSYFYSGNATALAMDGAGYLYTPISYPLGGWDMSRYTASGLYSDFSGGAEGLFTSLNTAPTSLFIDYGSKAYVGAEMNKIAISSLTSEDSTNFYDNQILPALVLEYMFFNFRSGEIATDTAGNLCIIDEDLGLVLKMNQLGVWSLVGSGWNRPQGLTTDSVGNLWVTDAGNNEVKRISPKGSQTTFGTGFSLPGPIAVGANGNVYVANLGNGVITGINRSTPPKLSFASTTVGKTSTDSPREVTIENMGNAPLVFPPPVSGKNPSLSTNFSLGSATTCPILSPTSSSFSLAPGATCLYAISFTPTVSGTISGTLTLTDNNLNGNKVTQSIALSGTATAVPAKLKWATPAPISPGTALGRQQLDATANIPGSFAYSPAAGTRLTAGTHTLTATFTPSDGERYGPAKASVQIVVGKPMQELIR